MVITVLSALSLSCYTAIVCYLIRNFAKCQDCSSQSPPFPVSVIVAARNEEKNLAPLLQSLVSQCYPSPLLEIVIVDDRSTDRTPQILHDWARRHAQIRPCRIDSGDGGKKNALAQGIARSSGELLLFTDADCLPPKEWVSGMVECFDEGVGFVAGFAPLVSRGKSLICKFMEFDALVSAFVAAAGICAQKPITCNGRNLAYRRCAYVQGSDFGKFAHLLSGDDDLYMHELARNGRWQSAYSTSARTFVPSAAAATMKSFILQRRRHFSTGRYYPFDVRLGYVSAYTSNLILLVAPLLALAAAENMALPALFVLLKLLVDWLALGRAAAVFERRGVMRYLPLWELCFPLVYSILGPLSYLGKISWR